MCEQTGRGMRGKGEEGSEKEEGELDTLILSAAATISNARLYFGRLQRRTQTARDGEREREREKKEEEEGKTRLCNALGANSP